MKHVLLLIKLFYAPRAAMSEIIDHGSWGFGAFAVTIVAACFSFTVTSPLYNSYEMAPVRAPMMSLPLVRPVALTLQGSNEEEAEPRAMYRRLPLPVLGNAGWWLVSFRPLSYFALALSLAVLFVPAVAFGASFQNRSVSYSVALRRDYASLLTCSFMAWTAAHIPAVLVGYVASSLYAPPSVFMLIWLESALHFGLLSVVALATTNGARSVAGLGAVAFGGVMMRLDSWLFSLATISPFFTIIWLLPLAFGALAGMRAAQVQQRSFRRYLDACTLNDHDAEAHIQLGLLYQQRGQTGKATAHFQRAIEIDPHEPDANFQLGIYARLGGKYSEAITRFEAVLRHDDKFRQSEIWREVGATYLGAGMLEVGRDALEKYLDRRPFDPEGLFYYGEVMRGLGETEAAMSAYAKCIEAVHTMPYYRRSQLLRWSKLARSRL